MAETLWDAITDFFAPETGRRRRAALDRAVGDAVMGLLGPTGVAERVSPIAEAVNPVASMERAGQASQRVFDPSLDRAQRIAATGDMLSEMAGTAAPGMLAARYGAPAAQAIEETLLGFSQPVRDVGADIVDRLNQPGPMPTLYSNPIMRAGGEAPEDFDFVGYRTVEAGVDPLAPSRVWEDDKPTGEYLPGVSVTDVNYPAAKSMHGMAAPNYREGLYFGDETYMIGGNKAVRGEDPGEFVISDPVIIKQLVRKYGIAGAAIMLGVSQADIAQAMEQQPQGLLEQQ